VDDLRAKANGLFASQSTTEHQDFLQSLHKINSDLKEAEPSINDTQLKAATDNLSQATNKATDYANSLGSPNMSNFDLEKITSIGMSISSTAVTYQLNFNRVCANGPATQAPQSAPSSSATNPKPPATTPVRPNAH
jgi:hypothetical protein